MRTMVYLSVLGLLVCAAASCGDDDDDEYDDDSDKPGIAGSAGTGPSPAEGGSAGETTVPTTGGTGGTTPSPEDGGTAGSSPVPEGGTGGESPVPSEGGSAGTEGGVTAACGTLLGSSTCDPVTGMPCDLDAGETCDFSEELNGFDCFEGPNDSGLCGPCGGDHEQFCGATTTCNGTDERCERYCCEDRDCLSGSCVKDRFNQPSVAAIGVCLEEADATCT